jgi:hypothetical protein
MNKKRATSSRQQATGRQAKNKQHADNADLKGFSQIRKKSAVIFFNLRHLSAYCINQHLEMSRRGINKATSCKQQATSRQATRKKEKETSMVRHCRFDPQRRDASRLYILGDSDFRQNDGYCYTEEMSRRGLNMYNPLQAERSWGYKITTTLSELRSSSICYHNNHSNHINHSSDRFSMQMTQILQIFTDKKKSAVIFLNLRHLRAYCLITSN